MNNLFQRTLTGALFVIILVFCILFSQYTFGAIFMVISVLGVIEFHKLIKEKYEVDINPIVPAICSAVLFYILFIIALCRTNIELLGFYFLLIAIIFIAELFLKKKNPILNWAFFVLGQAYIAFPFAMLNFIAFSQWNNYSPLLVLSFFVTVWVYDAGAYLVGMSIGKHRLFERISPKKSWEGFFGGMVFTLASGCIFAQFEPILNIWQWLGFSLIIVIFATLGDLSESLLKRTLGVKDSGTLLPGHGGILDRFDSVLFASLAISLYLYFI